MLGPQKTSLAVADPTACRLVLMQIREGMKSRPVLAAPVLIPQDGAAQGVLGVSPTGQHQGPRCTPLSLPTLPLFPPADVVNLDLKSTLRVLYNLFTKYKEME